MSSASDLPRDPRLHIVLYQPEIPANTGNIGRLCLGINARLHLIKPLRFLLDDKSLKRAGLDYWQELDWELHDNLDWIFARFSLSSIYMCSTKAQTLYTDYKYHPGDVFIFGPESRGLPKDLLDSHPQLIKIPMSDKIRSLNLANSAAIIAYEAIRQIGL
ncbi:MAG: tRNA (cytidine(34)-2'-O)-methyltransferase [Candidatus Cloacimonetes bacterium]|nr:tRNA (cytidine(34)-2'-O)-methyltransferase [Candidatus Cloacimonadota bacterium]